MLVECCLSIAASMSLSGLRWRLWAEIRERRGRKKTTSDPPGANANDRGTATPLMPRRRLRVRMPAHGDPAAGHDTWTPSNPRRVSRRSTRTDAAGVKVDNALLSEAAM